MDRPEGQTQRVLLLIDSTEDPAPLVAGNARTAFRHARIAHDLFDLAGPAPFPALAPYSAVLGATERLDRLAPDPVRALTDHVMAGGGFGTLYRCWSGDLDPLLGMVPGGGPGAVPPHPSGGLRFPGNALPAFEGVTVPPEAMIGHSGHDVTPAADADILASTFAGRPVAWTRRVGRGRTVCWNSIFLGERIARGLIVQTLECLQPVSVVPCANAGVVQIDDFPAPVDDRLPDSVRAAHPGLSAARFYAGVWYPDMQELARAFGLKYSAYVGFAYVKPSEMDAASADPERFGLHPELFDAIRERPPAELGLHGFTHFSLQLAKWPDAATMRASLRLARAGWDRFGCGAMPRSYVPPDNCYDATGLAVLRDVFPEITTLSGSHFGEERTGGHRDFGPEPWCPELYCLPRVTAGYAADKLFDALAQLAMMGAWTHFVHPDDVVDIPPPNTRPDPHRNPEGRPWRSEGGRRGLFDGFRDLCAGVRQRFPWLSWCTTSEAAARIAAHLQADWEITLRGDGLHVSGPEGGQFRLRLNHAPWRRVDGRDGCDCLHEAHAPGQSTYLLRMTAPTAILRLSDTTRLARAGQRLRAAVSGQRRAS